MPDDPLQKAAELLENAANKLIDVPAVLRGTLQQQAAAVLQQQATAAAVLPAAPLSPGYVHQPQTPLQQAAAAAVPPPLPLSQPGYVYQPQTPQQAAQQQAQQPGQYPTGGTPAWPQPSAPTPLQQAQQQATAPAGPTPGDSALAAARATPLGGVQTGPTLFQDVAHALGALKVAAMGARMALGTIQELGAKASPQAAATLAGSFDLLQARIGSAVLPAMEELSRAAQMVVRALPPDRLAQAGSAYVSYIKRFASPLFGAAMDIGESAGLGGPTAQSWAGLPQARTSSHEEAYERMQSAALNMDPLQEAMMKEQLQNLKDILGVLKDRPVMSPGAELRDIFR